MSLFWPHMSVQVAMKTSEAKIHSPYVAILAPSRAFPEWHSLEQLVALIRNCLLLTGETHTVTRQSTAQS